MDPISRYRCVACKYKSLKNSDSRYDQFWVVAWEGSHSINSVSLTSISFKSFQEIMNGKPGMFPPTAVVTNNLIVYN